MEFTETTEAEVAHATGDGEVATQGILVGRKHTVGQIEAVGESAGGGGDVAEVQGVIVGVAIGRVIAAAGEAAIAGNLGHHRIGIVVGGLGDGDVAGGVGPTVAAGVGDADRLGVDAGGGGVGALHVGNRALGGEVAGAAEGAAQAVAGGIGTGGGGVLQVDAEGGGADVDEGVVGGVGSHGDIAFADQVQSRPGDTQAVAAGDGAGGRTEGTDGRTGGDQRVVAQGGGAGDVDGAAGKADAVGGSEQIANAKIQVAAAERERIHGVGVTGNIKSTAVDGHGGIA